MWIVYRTNIYYGFEVPTENGAVEYCKENKGYKYIYARRL